MRTTIPPGTQSIARAIDLLKVLGYRRKIGWRLTDLAAHCQLDDSTVHRVMSCLSSLRLVQQRPQDRRYIPGPMLFELALLLPAYFSFQAACRQNIERISKRSGWVAYLFIRSGPDSVCIDLCGKSSVQLIVEVGTRRPLAGSATGIAMLLKLPPQEQKTLRLANRKELLTVVAHRKRSYDAMWEQSRRAGIGLVLGDIITGVASIGVAIVDNRGRPFGAIGVSGPLEEFTRDRIREVAKWMQAEARHIEREHHDLINSAGC